MNLRKLQRIAKHHLSSAICEITLDKTFDEYCGFRIKVRLHDIPDNLLDNVISEIKEFKSNSSEDEIILMISKLKEENIEEITIGKFLQLCKYINGDYYLSRKLGIKNINGPTVWSVNYSDEENLEQIVKGVFLGRDYVHDKLGFIFLVMDNLIK